MRISCGRDCALGWPVCLTLWFKVLWHCAFTVRFPSLCAAGAYACADRCCCCLKNSAGLWAQTVHIIFATAIN